MPHYQVYFDTLEGEKRYDVDIGDEEPLEGVIGEVLVELSEKGHVMRGLAVGDLKVIWGGREGRELDLSRTLPSQGVHPNDVLRVLTDIYEGGGSLRRDRIDNEWKLLDRLAAQNLPHLEVVDRKMSPVEDVFHVRLLNSPGVEHARGTTIVRRDQHDIRLAFTRYYPEQPIESYTEKRIFHPNIKPETGFICLWDQANLRDTVIQALARVQAMAAYRMVNMGAAHVMNREAGAWYETVAKPAGLVPLTWTELRVYDTSSGHIRWLEPGRRLTSGRSRLQ